MSVAWPGWLWVCCAFETKENRVLETELQKLHLASLGGDGNAMTPAMELALATSVVAWGGMEPVVTTRSLKGPPPAALPSEVAANPCSFSPILLTMLPL